PALASLTPRQALEKGMTTRGPYGGRGAGSSLSADLQLFLASRLHQKLDVNGSPEYELTWSLWDMPWGPPICRLRASARRTSGSDFSGWPTPIVDDAKNVTRTSGSYNSLARTATMTAMTHGAISSGSPAPTERRGALSPVLSMWLMGFPPQWTECGMKAGRR